MSPYDQHQRLMVVQTEIAQRIRWHLSPPTAEGVKAMHQDLTQWLRIPRNRVIQIEATCLMHTDYLSKFSLRLAEEYCGVE